MEEETERHLTHGRRNFCHVHQEVVMVRRQLAVHQSPGVALQTGRAKGHTEAAHPSVPRTPPSLSLPPRPGHTPPELLSCLFPSAGGEGTAPPEEIMGLRDDPNRQKTFCWEPSLERTALGWDFPGRVIITESVIGGKSLRTRWERPPRCSHFKVCCLPQSQGHCQKSNFI